MDGRQAPRNFLDWFYAQHGTRRRELFGESDEKLKVAVEKGKAAEAELARRREWDVHKDVRALCVAGEIR
jgi:hypothetical protein